MAEVNKMSVYAKLSAARLGLKELKKSGQNNFTKSGYFELSDILPAITKQENELGLFSQFGIEEDKATLKIYDVDEIGGDPVFFSIPIAHMTGGANSNPLQIIGAETTYCRRYLYLIAYNIAESDDIAADRMGELKSIDYTVNPKTGIKWEDHETEDLRPIYDALKKSKSPQNKGYIPEILRVLEARKAQREEAAAEPIAPAAPIVEASDDVYNSLGLDL